MANSNYYNSNNLKFLSRSLSPKAQALIKAVEIFGSVHVNQLPYIFDGLDNSKTMNVSRMLDTLKASGCFEKNGDFITPAGTNLVDLPGIDALWVAISLLYNEDESFNGNALRATFINDGVVSFIKDNRTIVNVIPFHGKADLTRLHEFDHRWNAYPDDKKAYMTAASLTIIAVRSLDSLIDIDMAGISFPHRIMVLEGDIAEYPNATFYDK